MHASWRHAGTDQLLGYETLTICRLLSRICGLKLKPTGRAAGPC